MPQSNVTLIRPVKLLHNITRFFYHWLYRRGVLEFVLMHVWKATKDVSNAETSSKKNHLLTETSRKMNTDKHALFKKKFLLEINCARNRHGVSLWS